MEAGKTIYLLVVHTGGNHVIISTSAPVKAGDMIKYTAANEMLLGEVAAVVQTQEGSEFHNWVKEASPYIVKRNIIKICRFDPEAIEEGE